MKQVLEKTSRFLSILGGIMIVPGIFGGLFSNLFYGLSGISFYDKEGNISSAVGIYCFLAFGLVLVSNILEKISDKLE